MDHFIKLYKKKKGKDLRKDVRAVQKLRREVEKAKRALSAAHQTPGLNQNTSGSSGLLRDSDQGQVRGAQHGSLQGNSQTSAEGESLETLYFSKVHFLNKSYQWPVSGA